MSSVLSKFLPLLRKFPTNITCLTPALSVDGAARKRRSTDGGVSVVFDGKQVNSSSGVKFSVGPDPIVISATTLKKKVPLETFARYRKSDFVNIFISW